MMRIQKWRGKKMGGESDGVQKNQNGNRGERDRPAENFHKTDHRQTIHHGFQQQQIKKIGKSVGHRTDDSQRRGAKKNGGGDETVSRFSGRIFLRRSQQVCGVTSDAVGNFLQPQQFAKPVAENECERGEKKLFRAGQKSSADAQPDQIEPEQNSERAERGLKKMLHARRQRPGLRKTKQRAGQNSKGVEKSADHENIVARGGEENNFLRRWRALSFCNEGRAENQMAEIKTNSRSPWFWVPSLYLAEGLPYALAMSVSAVLYKNLGVSNTDITFYTSWLYLPWVIKPLWSPVVDILKTRRLWIWTMQLFVGAALAGVALAIPAPHFFQVTLAIFWLLAFASATHDIAADGFYLLALPEREQALFSGVRNTFYRVANIAAQGGLIIFVGEIQKRTQNYLTAWLLAFALVAGIIFALGIYHRLMLPRPASDLAGNAGSLENFSENFMQTFVEFFRKPKIFTLLAFLLLYRFGEAQLLNVSKLFLLDPRSQGGLGLLDTQYGWLYGIVGVAALLAGGLLGGFVISRHGLKSWLWPMLLAIHLPDAVFIWLAYAQPENFFAIGTGIAIEQFGYGFGFAAFMLYMIYIARGAHATAHYAICTGFMAAGMMLPGLWSGWLQQHLGYEHFFVWVILATIPSFIVAMKIPLEPEFGKRNSNQSSA